MVSAGHKIADTDLDKAVGFGSADTDLDRIVDANLDNTDPVGVAGIVLAPADTAPDRAAGIGLVEPDTELAEVADTDLAGVVDTVPDRAVGTDPAEVAVGKPLGFHNTDRTLFRLLLPNYI